MVSYLSEKKNISGFEGAFVFPAQVGVFKGGSATVDFASLYPSNIRSINASPETYIGKVLIYHKSPDGTPLPVNTENEQAFNIFDDEKIKAPDILKFGIKYPDGKIKDIDVMKLRAWIEKHGIYTANNTIFLKHEEKWGVVAKWCEYFYNKRKSTKKQMFKYTHELHNNADKHTPEELAELKTNEENLNAKQLGFKSMINSIYGAMGTGYSPIANLDVAQSITRQGRFCNVNSSTFALKYLSKHYDPEYKGFEISVLDEDHPEYKTTPKVKTISISGDTDSFFIDLTPVTNWMKKKYGLPQLIREWTQEKKQELWDTMCKFTDNVLNPFVRNLVHNYCKTNQQDVLTYECEYMNAILIMEGKKHYLGHKIFADGDAVDSLKITGISLKKNETDKQMKNFLRDCYYGIIYHDWTENDYQNYINDLYEKFKTFDIDAISFWKGYNSGREAVGFLTMQVGTTGIAKAATYYNQIIDKLGLGKKYEQIRVGDKCRFCYIKDNNQYGIDCIAYKPGSWPAEFNELFEVDYSKMFDKIILDQLKRYREACGFRNIDPRK